MGRQFAAAFPYEETDSQLTAIADVNRDMEADYPMDRIVCGDVGYGKTEVALRAAFRAVSGGRQVAILVPTTILAYQHYQTALSRFRGFPVSIDMLSRFRSKAQQTASLRRLRRGETDIVIGTHRLISEDITFKNLGLVIVDEEQRFGVAQKEKLKEAAIGAGYADAYRHTNPANAKHGNGRHFGYERAGRCTGNALSRANLCNGA